MYRLGYILCIAYAVAVKSTYKMNRDTDWNKQPACCHPHTNTHSLTDTQPVFWLLGKAARSVWHWLLSANSTLGAALASFAANPGKEITDTHNAVFCLSAKKKTSPLSPRKKKGPNTNSHSLGPVLVQNQESPSSPGTRLLICAPLSGSLIQSSLVTQTT